MSEGQAHQDVVQSKSWRFSIGGTGTFVFTGVIVIAINIAHYYYNQEGARLPFQEWLLPKLAFGAMLTDAVSKTAVVALAVALTLQVTVMQKTNVIRVLTKFIEAAPVKLDRATSEQLQALAKQREETERLGAEVNRLNAEYAEAKALIDLYGDTISKMLPGMTQAFADLERRRKTLS